MVVLNVCLRHICAPEFGRTDVVLEGRSKPREQQDVRGVCGAVSQNDLGFTVRRSQGVQNGRFPVGKTWKNDHKTCHD